MFSFYPDLTRGKALRVFLGGGVMMFCFGGVFLTNSCKKTANVDHQCNFSVLHSIGALNGLWYPILVEMIRLPLW